MLLEFEVLVTLFFTFVNEMLSSGVKTLSSVARLRCATFARQSDAQVNAKKKELLSIQPAHEFLRAVKHKGKDVRTGNLQYLCNVYSLIPLSISLQGNAVAPRNLLHLLRRSTTAKDLHTAVNGVTFFQRKGADFSHLLCSQFINLCVQADKPKVVTDMILQPHHRLGAWVSKKSNLTLLKSLAKTDDLDTMISVSNATLKKGLSIQSKGSVTLMLEMARKAKNVDQYNAVMDIASKTLSSEELQEIKSNIPELKVAPAAVEKASA